jgi:predicted GTPase
MAPAAQNGHEQNGSAHETGMGGLLGVLNRRTRLVIMGAAGRDYHYFNTLFRDNKGVEVVAFTHAQIPHIESKSYPPELAGPLYPKGIPIALQTDLEDVIDKYKPDACLMAYSDVQHSAVTELAGRVRAAGAAFLVLSYDSGAMLRSKKPVIAVTAVRTGCGKSQVCRYVIDCLNKLAPGKQVVLVRHPMPYGKLEEQTVQRFGDLSDLDKHNTTIEEREEYEQHIKNGVVVYAGVDYGAILQEVEKEADFVLWDGGNNDNPFYKPDLWLCVADPTRPGHEESYYPGDTNFKKADIIVINKANNADQKGIDQVMEAAKRLNPKALVVQTASEVTVDKEELVKGKRVCCVEDGPTITHGGAPTGAAYAAAQKFGAAEVVDPRPHAVGKMKETLEKFPHIEKVVPAMGYSGDEIKDLEKTLNSVPCDTVVVGTPTSIDKLIKLQTPAAVVTYTVKDLNPEGPQLSSAIEDFLKKVKAQ